MVTRNDIVAIRGGQTKMFDLGTDKMCNSVRATVSWVNKHIKPADVEAYATKTNKEKTVIWITAIQK